MNTKLYRFTGYLYGLLFISFFFYYWPELKDLPLLLDIFTTSPFGSSTFLAGGYFLLYPLIFLSIIISINKLNNYERSKTGNIAVILSLLYGMSFFTIRLLSVFIYEIPAPVIMLFYLLANEMLLWGALALFTVKLWKIKLRFLPVLIGILLAIILIIQFLGAHSRKLSSDKNYEVYRLANDCDSNYSSDIEENARLRKECLDRKQDKETTTLAVGNNDVQYCYNLITDYAKKQCFFTLINNNVNNQDDVAFCKLINDPYLKTRCIDQALVLIETDQGNIDRNIGLRKEYCPLMDDYGGYRNLCYIGLVSRSKDVSYCSKVSESSQQVCKDSVK